MPSVWTRKKWCIGRCGARWRGNSGEAHRAAFPGSCWSPVASPHISVHAAPQRVHNGCVEAHSSTVFQMLPLVCCSFLKTSNYVQKYRNSRMLNPHLAITQFNNSLSHGQCCLIDLRHLISSPPTQNTSSFPRILGLLFIMQALMAVSPNPVTLSTIQLPIILPHLICRTNFATGLQVLFPTANPNRRLHTKPLSSHIFSSKSTTIHPETQARNLWIFPKQLFSTLAPY